MRRDGRDGRVADSLLCWWRGRAEGWPGRSCWSRPRPGVGRIWWPVSCCSIRPPRLSPSRRAAGSSRGCVAASCCRRCGSCSAPIAAPGAGPGCAAASVFAELSPSGSARVGWETVVYDGDLGDLPLVLVIPRDLIGGEAVLAATQDAAEGRTDQPLLPPEPGPVPVDVDVVTAGAHAGGNGPRLNGHDGLSSGGDVRRDGTEASRVRV